ncbi:Uncharacterised protein [Serratia proteamaculans]|nr:Uncharacterised protein [Serratia proteamaculans]CAI1138534.1 Uncharacterised protein [Serratia proteamaculans]
MCRAGSATSSEVKGLTIEIHNGRSNVYTDLEFPYAEAMYTKVQLIVGLDRVFQSRQWPQGQAVVGAVSVLAFVMRSHFHSYRVADLEHWLKQASRES